MIKIQAKHGIVMDNPNSLFSYFGWPSVTRLPDGTLAATASGFRMAHMCPFGKSVISYSRDEGETWTRPAVLIDTLLDDRDTGIACIGGNRVMVTSFNNKLEQQRVWADQNYAVNTELGSAARAFKQAYCDLAAATGVHEKYLGAVYMISEDGGYTFGEIRNVPVASIHGPCMTPDGDVLLIGYALAPKPSESSIQCWRLKADDTFEHYSDIPCAADGEEYNFYEPHAAALPDGSIVVLIRTHPKSKSAKPHSTFCSISRDGGKTFSPPVDTGNRGYPSHVLRHSSGVLIAAYPHRLEPKGQSVMFSHDNGETWEKNYILRDDTPSDDYGYPCTVELNDGSLLTVYYQSEWGEPSVPNASVEVNAKTGIPVANIKTGALLDEKTKNPIIMYSKWSLDGLF